MKLRKIHWAIIAVVVIALGSVGALPSYSFVSVQGPDGNITVQKSGFGNNGIHVKTGDADIRVNNP